MPVDSDSPTERYAEQVMALDAKINGMTKKLESFMAMQREASMLGRTNYHRVIQCDTSSTIEHPVDVFRELSNHHASLLEVISIGGGIQIAINDEEYITPASTLRFRDELISRFRWKGTGGAGTAEIRLGTWIKSE
jgi:hypothetical protein